MDGWSLPCIFCITFKHDEDKMRLLSVDWDWFFPDDLLNELAPRKRGSRIDEDEFWGDGVWDRDAQKFLTSGHSLPGTSGDEDGFWDRFKIGKKTTLFLANAHERNRDPKVIKSVTEVVNFDAHHDAGYRESLEDALEKPTCGNWANQYLVSGVPVKVIYPSWKDRAMTEESAPTIPSDHPIYRAVERVVDDGSEGGSFRRLFICRSSAWTPPWLDNAFDAFVAACPANVVQLGEMKNRDWSPQRRDLSARHGIRL